MLLWSWKTNKFNYVTQEKENVKLFLASSDCIPYFKKGRMWKLLSRVWLCDPVHGILQARILEWVSFSLLQGIFSISFSRGIFPIQGLNSGLLHCRQILYQLSHQWSPKILEWVPYHFSSGSPNPGIDPGIKLGFPALQANSLPAELPRKPHFKTWNGMGNIKCTGKGSSADQGLGEFFKYCYALLPDKSYAEEHILNTDETNVFYKNLGKGFYIAKGISVDKNVVTRSSQEAAPVLPCE